VKPRGTGRQTSTARFAGKRFHGLLLREADRSQLRTRPGDRLPEPCGCAWFSKRSTAWARVLSCSARYRSNCCTRASSRSSPHCLKHSESCLCVSRVHRVPGPFGLCVSRVHSGVFDQVLQPFHFHDLLHFAAKFPCQRLPVTAPMSSRRWRYSSGPKCPGHRQRAGRNSRIQPTGMQQAHRRGPDRRGLRAQELPEALSPVSTHRFISGTQRAWL
jgi:hypothetical protein